MSDIAVELKTLEKTNGSLLPQDVVEAARNPNSPLHSHFTWDDTEAARKHRLNEARTLIRLVKLDVIVRDVPIQVCSYVRDPEVDAKDAGYRNVKVVRSEEDLARAVIIEELKRVSNAVNRDKKLALLLGCQDDIEKIDEIVKNIVNIIETNTPTGELQ